MIAPKTGKQRAALMPLDYYRRPDRLAWWNRFLAALALLASLGWAAADFVLSDRGNAHASRGPVAGVHQIWDQQCTACHEPFTPISSSSWKVPFFHSDLKKSIDKCQTCHAGADHYAQQSQQPSVSTCASCHREHQGREASLVKLPDSDCTQCHQDLSKHPAPEGSKIEKSVTRFAKGTTHPEFKSIKTDPRKLKFNHRLHLTEGIALVDTDGTLGKKLTLADMKIPEIDKQRYQSAEQKKNKDFTGPVQLNCASCHQLDVGDFGVTEQQEQAFPFSLLGRRSAGAYMLPISYENQCRACHPLTVPNTAEKEANLLKIPHRLPAGEIHDLLSNFFTAQVKKQTVLSKRPLPGKGFDPLDTDALAVIHKKMNEARIDLYHSKLLCNECHYFEPEAMPAGESRFRPVAPTQIPRVWLKYAKFDHAAHRAVDCAQCHTVARDDKEKKDILMIPNQDNCLQCHGESNKVGFPGARFNCTECHQYHNAEHSLQGLGAAKRNPSQLLDIDDFLTGKKKNGKANGK